MSRGERSRTLGWAYMMSPGSGEWSRPIRCPISCRASTRTSSGANGCPLASKVARVTTPPVRCPSSSHCRSVCPERSPSNWIRHWTRTSAELESASRLNRTGTPASCLRWNALRTASRKAGWKLSTPVRVYFPPTTVANFQPAFLDAVRSAFQRWQEAGVPVRFNLDADSSSAEVRVQWRIQFEGERSGQTDLQWDDDGHLTGGVVTLATFDAKGQPFAPDDVRVLALHEIGHLIGLDHSPDPGDIMYAQPKVRDLSPRDIRTASLLYDLAPGALRVGA